MINRKKKTQIKIKVPLDSAIFFLRAIATIIDNHGLSIILLQKKKIIDSILLLIMSITDNNTSCRLYLSKNQNNTAVDYTSFVFFHLAPYNSLSTIFLSIKGI